MKDIIFITFDIPRSEYPTISYSVASMFVAVQNSGFKLSHFPIDVSRFFKTEKKFCKIRLGKSGNFYVFREITYVK